MLGILFLSSLEIFHYLLVQPFVYLFMGTWVDSLNNVTLSVGIKSFVL